MRKILIATAASAALLCAGTSINTAAAADSNLVGMLVGAATGGFIGSNIGQGSGRLAATAAGTLVGAMIGSSFGGYDAGPAPYRTTYAHADPRYYGTTYAHTDTRYYGAAYAMPPRHDTYRADRRRGTTNVYVDNRTYITNTSVTQTNVVRRDDRHGRNARWAD